MAGADPLSVNYMLSCQVCLEDYEENGDHVPRILPCLHTVCETCLKKLIKEGSIDCPECERKHEATDEVRSTPNEYILSSIRKEMKAEREHGIGSDKCPDHGKDLDLYCRQQGCQKGICSSCLLKSHVGHDIVEMDVKKKEAFLKKLDSVSQTLQKKKMIMLDAKDELTKKTNDNLDKLKKKREEITKRINQLMKKVSDDNNHSHAKMNNVITAIDGDLVHLDSVKTSQEGRPISQADTSVIHEVEENIRCNLSGTETYSVSMYKDDELCGEVVMEKFDANLSKDNLPDYALNPANNRGPTLWRRFAGKYLMDN